MPVRGRAVVLALTVAVALLRGVGGCGSPEPRTPPASPPPSGPREVRVFFARPDTCAVQGFARTVPGGPALDVTRAALQSLLDGPDDAERAAGFVSAIPDSLEVQRHRMRYMAFGYDAPHHGRKVGIQTLEARADGVLYVSFSPELNAYDRGAVRVCTIVRQVQATVTQFPEWKAVRIAVDGKTEGVLQP